MTVHERLFTLADEIADRNLPHRFFRWRLRLVEKIRLRQDIYDALVQETLNVGQ